MFTLRLSNFSPFLFAIPVSCTEIWNWASTSLFSSGRFETYLFCLYCCCCYWWKWERQTGRTFFRTWDRRLQNKNRRRAIEASRCFFKIDSAPVSEVSKERRVRYFFYLCCTFCLASHWCFPPSSSRFLKLTRRKLFSGIFPLLLSCLYLFLKWQYFFFVKSQPGKRKRDGAHFSFFFAPLQ